MLWIRITFIAPIENEVYTFMLSTTCRNIISTKLEIGVKGFITCLTMIYKLALSYHHKHSNMIRTPYLGFKAPLEHGTSNN